MIRKAANSQGKVKGSSPGPENRFSKASTMSQKPFYMKTPSSSIFLQNQKNPYKQLQKVENENIDDDSADCLKLETKNTNFH